MLSHAVPWTQKLLADTGGLALNNSSLDPVPSPEQCGVLGRGPSRESADLASLLSLVAETKVTPNLPGPGFGKTDRCDTQFTMSHMLCAQSAQKCLLIRDTCNPIFQMGN